MQWADRLVAAACENWRRGLRRRQQARTDVVIAPAAAGREHPDGKNLVERAADPSVGCRPLAVLDLQLEPSNLPLDRTKRRELGQADLPVTVGVGHVKQARRRHPCPPKLRRQLHQPAVAAAGPALDRSQADLELGWRHPPVVIPIQATEDRRHVALSKRPPHRRPVRRSHGPGRPGRPAGGPDPGFRAGRSEQL